MDAERSLTPQEKDELRRWLSAAGRGSPEEQAAAASELGRLGVWTRSSIRTRGSVTRSAPARVPEPASLEALTSLLSSDAAVVRCQAARALGEWGGEEAARRIARGLQAEANRDARLYFIGALRVIGGPIAVEALRQLVGSSGTDTERDLALLALEELVTGGRREDTEAAPPGAAASIAVDMTATRAESSEGLRVRRVISTRGIRSEPHEDSIEAVGQTLHRIENDEKTSAYLRLRAAAVARMFDSS